MENRSTLNLPHGLQERIELAETLRVPKEEQHVPRIELKVGLVITIWGIGWRK